MLPAVTSFLFGRRSDGAPAASSSRAPLPRSQSLYTRDDDDNRSIASDPPPSDEDDRYSRRRSSYIPARDKGKRTTSLRVKTPDRHSMTPSRRPSRGPQVVLGALPPAPPLCIICNTKPSFVNPGTGKSHPTCGNTCAKVLSTLCEVCLTRPRNGTYTTCGTTCGKALKAQKALCPQCKIRPKLVDSNGKELSHCGKTCRDAAQKGVPPAPATPIARTPQVAQHVAPTAVAPMTRRNTVAYLPDTFETLKAQAKGSAPCFLEIPKNHAQFGKVLDLFDSDWDGQDGAPPPVVGIYSVVQSDAQADRHDRYRAHLIGKGLCPTDSRRWIGVKCSCRPRPQIKPPCSAYDCSMCDALTRNVFGTSRYPGASVLSGHSNRADTLAFSGQSHSRHNGLKAVILAKLVGSDDLVPRLTFDEAYTGREAGRGKDIVQLSSDQRGRPLPSDQIVVFNTDAIIPRYVVLYK